MKKIFIAILFTSLSVAAVPQADISCSNAGSNTRFSINTKAGKVWYNDSIPVNGPVFSGVYSAKNYAGEILGEIELNKDAFYLTLILRNVKGKAQLEARWYPKNDQNQVTRYFLNNCDLKQ